MQLLFYKEERFFYDILLSENYSITERYAAEQLKKYIALSTGKIIEINIENLSQATSNHIYIGQTDFFKKHRIDIINADLKEDSVLMKFIGNDIVLAGKSTEYSSSSVLYSVYCFLERFLHIKFLAHDEELIPTHNTIFIKKEDVIEQPDFVVRDVMTRDMRLYPEYMVKRRVKHRYTQAPAHLGGSAKNYWGYEYGHNFYQLISPIIYSEKYPEWFDLENKQLCLSNFNLADEIIEELKRRIVRSKGKFYAVSQNDTTTPCQCALCKENYAKFSVSGTLIRFVNYIANKIEIWRAEKIPDREIFLTTYAYYFSYKPPVKKEDGKWISIDKSCVPQKNIYIHLTTIDYCFYHPLDFKDCTWNEEFTDVMDGWKSITSNFHMFHYGTNYPHYFYPFFNFNSIQQNYRLFKELGIYDLIDLGTVETGYTDFQELKGYVSSKLMWNCNENIKALISEFIEGYYKEAASEVSEYYKLLEKHYQALDLEKGWHQRLYHLPEEMFSFESFPLEFINALLNCIDKGIEKIKKIKDTIQYEKILQRLLRLSMTPKYLILINYDHYYKTGKDEFSKNFVNEALKLGFIKYKEKIGSSANISELISLSSENKIIKTF